MERGSGCVEHPSLAGAELRKVQLGMKAKVGRILCHTPSALLILLWVFLVSLASVLSPLLPRGALAVVECGGH